MLERPDMLTTSSTWLAQRLGHQVSEVIFVFSVGIWVAPLAVTSSCRRAPSRNRCRYSVTCSRQLSMFASGQIDFVCVPVDFKHCASDGFAFINLLSLEQNNFEDVPFCAGAIETVMTQ